ncbi:MAG: hypothetical protein FWF57_03895 [Defluviitaleaceae bacterium]|nr:hypothetical protein [Defluviitaleaceae bacterium]
MNQDKKLKKLYFKKLSNGKNILMSYGSNLLLVDNYEDLSNISDLPLDDSFFLKDGEIEKILPDENSNFKNILLFLLTFISLSITLVFTFIFKIPTGRYILNTGFNIYLSIIITLTFSFIVALIHEFMHIIYAKNFGYLKNGGIKFKNIGVFTVEIDHIWLWNKKSRISTLMAGISFELILMSLMYIFYFFNNYTIIMSFISILWFKIIWQFQLHKKYDVHLIAMMIIDDPFIEQDYKNLDYNKKNAKVWILLKILGFFVQIILIVFWAVPLLFSIYNLFKGV